MIPRILFNERISNNARFRGAVLTGANLSGATFVDADLTNADLSGCILTGACLVGAKLDNTDLRNTPLAGANLRGCQSLSGTHLFEKTRTQSGPVVLYYRQHCLPIGCVQPSRRYICHRRLRVLLSRRTQVVLVVETGGYEKAEECGVHSRI